MQEYHHTFPLRMLSWRDRQGWKMVCLETDIAVIGRSEEEARVKMIDALVLYFRSFDPDQIARGDFRRSAPLWYRLRWYFDGILQTLKMAHFRNREATIDPRDAHVSFA